MKKFCKNYLYYHLLADILAVVVYAFAFIDVLVIENDLGEFVGIRTKAIPFFILGALVVYGLIILYQVLYLRTAGYTLMENEIRVTRGVLFRKNSILEYKKMHAINKKQNIIQKLFGLAVLTVDSGSANTSGTTEILIYETEKEADALLALLKARKNGELTAAETVVPTEEVLSTENGDLVFSSGKKMIYSLLNIVSAAFSMIVIGLFALIVYVCLVPFLHGLLVGDALYALVPALVIALILLVGVALITFIVNVLQAFIGYYKFRIVKNGGDLEISYGLVTRHTNTFGYNRIQGVVVQQGLIQRLFGYATLRLEVIGYHEGGDEQNNSGGSVIGMLLPLCHVREVESILGSILPAYVPVKKQTPAKKYFPFISWSSLLIGAITALVALLTLSMMHLFSAPARALAIVRLLILLAFAIAMAVHLFGAYLSYKNAGLAISEDKITVYGGGYQKKVTTILRRSLIAVEDVTTPMRAKNGIYTLILHIRTNAESNEIKVGMLDRASAQKLKEFLRD